MPVGAVVLLVAGAARPRGLMGHVIVKPPMASSHVASCLGSYTSRKMDARCVTQSNMRLERCSFTNPFSYHWRKHSSQ